MTTHTHAQPVTVAIGLGEQPYVDPGIIDGPPEALVVDIGDDIGALILYATESCLGQEIDLTAVGAPRSHHMHTMIRRRRTAFHHIVAGVYPELAAGDYTIWGLDGAEIATVTISGGHVTEFDAGDCQRPAPVR